MKKLLILLTIFSGTVSIMTAIVAQEDKDNFKEQEKTFDNFPPEIKLMIANNLKDQNLYEAVKNLWKIYNPSSIINADFIRNFIMNSDSTKIREFFEKLLLDNPEYITSLLRAKIINSKDLKQDTRPGFNMRKNVLLLRAINRNNILLTKVLIEAGANPNFNPSAMPSALMTAVMKNNSKMVKILLNAGADINKTDVDIITGLEFTPLEYAIENDYQEIVNLIQNSNNK